MIIGKDINLTLESQPQPLYKLGQLPMFSRGVSRWLKLTVQGHLVHVTWGGGGGGNINARVGGEW